MHGPITIRVVSMLDFGERRGEWSTSSSAALPPAKESRYPLWLGGSGPDGRVRKISPPHQVALLTKLSRPPLESAQIYSPLQLSYTFGVLLIAGNLKSTKLK